MKKDKKEPKKNEDAALKAEIKANEDLAESHREEIKRYRDIEIPASRITLKKREDALDEYAARSNELKETAASADEKLEELKKTIEKQTAELAGFEKTKSELEEEIQRNQQALDEIGSRIDQLDDQKKKMIEEISSKQEQLGMSDISELQNKFDEVSAQLEQQQAQHEELTRNIETIKAERAATEEKCAQLRNDIRGLAEEVNAQSEKVDELDARRRDIEDARAKLREKHNELVQIIGELNSPESEANVRICENEIEVMQDAIDRLFPNVDLAGLTLFERKEQMDKKSRYFREEIQRIRNLLEDYKSEYRKLIKAIEGGASEL